jgi:integrase
MSDRDARRVLRHINELELSQKLARAPDQSTSTWAARLPAEMIRKLERAGLVLSSTRTPRRISLGEFCDQYIKRRLSEIKPRSVALLDQSRRKLLAHFGDSITVDQLTANSAAEWRTFLIASGLAEATCRLHSRNARVMFASAVSAGLVSSNPFSTLPTASVAAERGFYLTREATARLLDHVTNPDLRVVVALGRYAGLRIPSETHSLRWQDVDLDNGKLSVYAPKLHRHGATRDSAVRVVPIVPQLAAVLTNHASDDPNEPVVNISSNNLYRQVRKAIDSAGLPMWSDLFQTLRRSCETDLCDSFPSHAVATWIGHSVQVAERHYLMVPDELYKRAAEIDQDRALQNALQLEPVNIDLIANSVASVMAEISGRDLRNSALSLSDTGHLEAIDALYSVQLRRWRTKSAISAGPVAQRLEQATHNRSVAGSTPARAIFRF